MKPDNQYVLIKFFEAENRRDWDSYGAFLSDTVVWELHSGCQVKTMRGKESYIAYMQSVYQQNNNTFICEAMYVSGGGNRIAAILKNSRGERSCDIFNFFDGLICREYEFTLE